MAYKLPPPKPPLPPEVKLEQEQEVLVERLNEHVKALNPKLPDPRKNHKAKGGKPGWPGPGPGRPKGSKHKLGPGSHGLQKSLKQLRHLRIPKDATPAEIDLAHEGLKRIVDIMNGKIGFPDSGVQLKAAIYAREEVCGPVARQLNLQGTMTWARALEEADKKEIDITPTPLRALPGGKDGDDEG